MPYLVHNVKLTPREIHTLRLTLYCNVRFTVKLVGLKCQFVGTPRVGGGTVRDCYLPWWHLSITTSYPMRILYCVNFQPPKCEWASEWISQIRWYRSNFPETLPYPYSTLNGTTGEKFSFPCAKVRAKWVNEVIIFILTRFYLTCNVCDSICIIMFGWKFANELQILQISYLQQIRDILNLNTCLICITIYNAWLAKWRHPKSNMAEGPRCPTGYFLCNHMARVQMKGILRRIGINWH